MLHAAGFCPEKELFPRYPRATAGALEALLTGGQESFLPDFAVESPGACLWEHPYGSTPTGAGRAAPRHSALYQRQQRAIEDFSNRLPGREQFS
jgi:hypothetical protein